MIVAILRRDECASFSTTRGVLIGELARLTTVIQF